MSDVVLMDLQVPKMDGYISKPIVREELRRAIAAAVRVSCRECVTRRRESLQ